MANDISAVTPLLFSAQQTVARELTGFIASVDQKFDDKQAAVGQIVEVPISPLQGSADYTPSQNVNNGSAGTDRTLTNVNVIITASKMSTFHLTGEQDRALTSGGNTIAQETFKQSMTQAMRTIANLIEDDLSNIYKSASRAVGTAGTTPFGSDLTAATAALKELLDNGVPMADLHLVIDTAAGQKLRNQVTVTNASQYQGGVAAAGLKTGMLWDLFGLQTSESAKVKLHTAGAGTGYDIVAAGAAAGATTLGLEGGTVNTTGLKAGDVAVIGSTDTSKYIINTGLVATTGNIVIGNPGLLSAKVDADELVVGASYRANVALYRGAAVLVVRPPAIEATPLIQTQIVMDEKTGLPFMVCRCLGDGLVTWRVHAAWGYKVVQSEFLINLMG